MYIEEGPTMSAIKHQQQQNTNSNGTASHISSYLISTSSLDVHEEGSPLLLTLKE